MRSGSDGRLWTIYSGYSATEPSRFVSGGEIKIAKLMSTLLGSLWLVVAAGWISITQAIVQIHVSLLDAAAQMYYNIIVAFGTNAARASRETWGEAFRAAVEVSPLLAPALFSIELIVFAGIILAAGRRWT